MPKILIIEDNELNLRLFNDLLFLRNFDIVISVDGLRIEELVLKERPDLILMDIQLNGISGIDLIRILKRNEATKNIPIIAVTAFAMKNDEARIVASGCEVYLSKPISISSFFEAIDKYI